MKLSLVARSSALKLSVVPHWLVLTITTLVSAFGGAVGNYLIAIPASEWVTGLTQPKSLIPLGIGALVSGVSALLAQAVQLLKAWGASQTPQ